MAGKWVIVTVEAEQEARMLNQLRYHFGVVCKLISDQTGYTKEEVHEILKAENLSQPYSIGERTVYTVGSTTSLTWKEMEDFDERNRRWAAENLDLSIPERGEVF